MLLCKQPGDTGVFATATQFNIRIYRFSSLTSQLLQETKATAEATTAAADALQTELDATGNEWEGGAALGPLSGAFARTASTCLNASFAAVTTRKGWGRPIDALCVVPLWRLQDAENFSVAGNGAQGIGRLYMSSLQRKLTGGRSGGGDYHAGAPLSLSLSCAQGDALRFLYSSRGVGAWIGAENALSALYTTSTLSGTPYDATYLNNGADIVASGWDPVNAAALAIGMRNGVVQLLDIESSNGVKPSTLHSLSAAAAEVSNRSSDIQTQLGTFPVYTSALTRNNAEWVTVSAMSLGVVRERQLNGALTSLDWAPHSHTTVVAAERSDGNGHCVEVMDLRSPDNDIRYLGMPFETTSSPASSINESGAGARVSSICYAEFVACDYTGTYVATAGSQSRRDVVQLWDLRMTSRPVCQKLHSRAGYTSLSWCMLEIPTVVATTRGGGLRVHAFGDVRSDSDDDEVPLSGRGSNRTSGHSFCAPFFSSSRRTFESFEDRFHLQPRVPAAAVAWLGDCRSHARGLEGAMAEENRVGKQGGDQADDGRSQHVAVGGCTDMPCLILLNAKTGELYLQAFSLVGCRTTMLGDFSLCSAGPNVFILDTRVPLGQQPAGKPAEHERTNFNNNIMGGASAHNNYDCDSETERDGSSLYNFAENQTSNGSGMSFLATAAVAGTWSADATRVDRLSRRLDRLRAGFLPQSDKVFSVLLEEQCDREAYVLFRYGWYMQRYLHPGRAALPVPDSVPGLLELLEREQSGRASEAAAIEVSNLILCAMGWVTDPRDEQLMLTPRGDNIGGSVGTAAKPPGRQEFSSEVLLARLQPQLQQPREKSTTVSPNSWSHVSGDDVMDATCLVSSTFPREPAASPSVSLDPVDHVGVVSMQEAVERRVAILVCMYRLKEASALLLHYNHLHPLYSTFALVLLAAASHNGIPPTLTLDVSECSFWMGVCFFFLGTFRTPIAPSADQEQREKDCSARGGGSNENGGISDLYRFPLSMRRECFASLTRWFPQIPLSDRIALATLLLLDPAPTAPSHKQFQALSEILQEMQQQQFETNGAGGCSLLLAAIVEGLGGNCPSLQRYVDETSDVQTPVVYAALYGHGKSASWCFWNDAYRSQLNAEGHAILRSLHDLSCKKLARLREQRDELSVKHGTVAPPPPPLGRLDGFSPLTVGMMGVPFSGLAGGAAAEAKVEPKRTDERNVELRCKCGQIVATSPMELAVGATTIGRRQQSLCGSPNCLTPMCAVCGEKMFALASGYDVATSYTWCTVCLHGGHWSHLRDWFAKHKTCPAEDCPCRCYCPSLPP
ncbi:hypothetical protein TraAM80_00731 [Trypanosoma rangeli]|uniref:WD repeat protein mio zinc-ribbon like domain-containing protein n=1 Tax=Trypanosoma rangeli TaxID=5698 RepID=A0A3R7N2F9_TRYRA|nr:uncharacterized protein TraAM80_00731 [Trypanosoma rangeli]RNF11748.1 hypothetical protein TraAM80_00731 [Trypanosoma rangeli]|eukprot:RNF11748.1 hypothetical protein TraAM80_00731 [Trypanosoma rangeli]